MDDLTFVILTNWNSFHFSKHRFAEALAIEDMETSDPYFFEPLEPLEPEPASPKIWESATIPGSPECLKSSNGPVPEKGIEAPSEPTATSEPSGSNITPKIPESSVSWLLLFHNVSNWPFAIINSKSVVLDFGDQLTDRLSSLGSCDWRPESFEATAHSHALSQRARFGGAWTWHWHPWHSWCNCTKTRC